MIFKESIGYCMAHHLPEFPAGHKCRNIHGHTCTLVVSARVPSDQGQVLDHADARAAWWSVVKTLDHAGVINGIDPALADGTVEAQLRWFWPQLALMARALGCELVQLEHLEDSAPGGVRLTHTKLFTADDLDR